MILCDNKECKHNDRGVCESKRIAVISEKCATMITKKDDKKDASKGNKAER